jgi:hypothetical protein
MLVRKTLILFISLLVLSPQGAVASEKDPSAAEKCDVNMEMNRPEQKSFNIFRRRLGSLQGHYGRYYFQNAMNAIIEKQWPTERIIEVSATFMERTLNLVDQHYLRHAVASTIGLKDKRWIDFERDMINVTLDGDTLASNGRSYDGKSIGAKHFATATERLVEAITNLKPEELKLLRHANERKRPMDPEQAEILKARAVTMIANMYIYIERWNIINKEINRLRRIGNTKKILFIAMGVTTVGLLVASTIYAGPIIAAAGTFGAKFSTDIIVASQLARLAQVAAGAGLGAVGAPTTVLLTDTTKTLLNAQRESRNNGTVYACEIDKQIQAWKERGVSPYINAAVLGGSVGMAGVMTFTTVGAKTLLLASSFGVGVALSSSLYGLSENTIYGLAEYRLALEENKKGNKELAIEHAQKSREYFSAAGEDLLNSLLVGVLAAAFTKDFSKALAEGEAVIRALYANSADTLPTALSIAEETLSSL